MRYLVLLVLIMVLASCTSPEPTTATPPTPTPTPTPLPVLRASAEELAASIKGQIAGAASREEFRKLADVIGGEAVDILCKISDGMFEPDLAMVDLTDNQRVHMVIKAHCIRLEGT